MCPSSSLHVSMMPPVPHVPLHSALLVPSTYDESRSWKLTVSSIDTLAPSHPCADTQTDSTPVTTVSISRTLPCSGVKKPEAESAQESFLRVASTQQENCQQSAPDMEGREEAGRRSRSRRRRKRRRGCEHKDHHHQHHYHDHHQHEHDDYHDHRQHEP